jgi:hypothetical protein
MIRRGCIIGTLALVLGVSAFQRSPALCRLVSSAQNVQHYFRDLKGAGSSLNPVERFVYSLVLASTKTPPLNQAGFPASRT